MARTIIFQRLNRSPKHRWSMLRNQTASLILHERIKTTYARAKCLVPLVNKVYSLALRKTKHSYSKINSIVRIKEATDKLYNNLLNKFKFNQGGIVRIVPIQKRRLNDAAEMAYVELVQNPKKNKEDTTFRHIHRLSGMNFTQWELFTRKTELRKYTRDKEKVDEIYNILKQKIEEVLKKSTSTNPKDIANQINQAVFGENFTQQNFIKLKNDPLIPTQHYINLYLKAHNPQQLENFYLHTTRYLNHIIKQSHMQIENLQSILANKKLAKNHEKNNFSRYFDEYTYYNKFYNDVIFPEIEEKENERKIKIKAYLKPLIEQNKEIKPELEYLKKIDNFMKYKGLDPFDLTKEQSNEIEQYGLREETLMNFEDSTIPKEVKDTKYYTKNYHADFSSPMTEEEHFDKNFINNLSNEFLDKKVSPDDCKKILEEIESNKQLAEQKEKDRIMKRITYLENNNSITKLRKRNAAEKGIRIKLLTEQKLKDIKRIAERL